MWVCVTSAEPAASTSVSGHLCMYMYTHLHVHTEMHLCMDMYMYTYLHMHIQRSGCSGPSGMPDNPEPSAGDDPNQVKMRSCATHPSATDSDSCLVTAFASAILSGSPAPPLPSALLKRRMPST